ncbi:MAG: AI-2E family transporter, partial [Pseudomonadota bacterium]
LVCFLEYHGMGQLLGVAVVFAIIQGLEGLLLTPYLVGEKVGLGPVGVLIALMIGGTLFGFVGVLLAVPGAAAGVIVVRRGLASYRKGSYFNEGADPPEGGSRPSDNKEANYFEGTEELNKR